MCHLVLLMPFLALPVFWLLPMYLAAPVYAVVLLLSAGVYWLAIRAMHMPLACGAPAMLHRRGPLIEVNGRPRLKLGGEIWEVESKFPLKAGQTVEAIARDGLKLRVRPLRS